MINFIENEELVKDAIEVIMSESAESLAERLDDYELDDDIEEEWEEGDDPLELKIVLTNHVYQINSSRDHLEHFIDIFSGLM